MEMVLVVWMQTNVRLLLIIVTGKQSAAMQLVGFLVIVCKGIPGMELNVMISMSV